MYVRMRDREAAARGVLAGEDNEMGLDFFNKPA
jgi:hypothetical protein